MEVPQPSSPAPVPLGSKSKQDLTDIIKESHGIILRQSRKIEKLEQLVSKLQKENSRLLYDNNQFMKGQHITERYVCPININVLHFSSVSAQHMLYVV